MVKNGLLTGDQAQSTGDGTAAAPWTRWLDHLMEAADAQMPKASDAASAVAQAWRSSRAGGCGLRFAAR